MEIMKYFMVKLNLINIYLLIESYRGAKRKSPNLGNNTI